MTSVDLLERSLEAWTVIYGRQLSDEVLKTWVEIFERVDPALLEPALHLATERCKRMPTPGDLTEAIDGVRERRNFRQLEEHRTYMRIASRDPETGAAVDAWLDPQSQEVLYRGQDCPEGRKFLALLRGC